MGGNSSKQKSSGNSKHYDVDFDDFQILRAIGKGSFGKVCIVQKKDDESMYAMKYMNKNQCIQKDAIRNVMREIEILTSLDHPFLVNLWFSFQDDEDMFMVVDLLLGGDLRYHIQQSSRFSEETVRLYIVELALALDYLRSKNILHRDIKPDNIILDDLGHVHITDFNIATVLDGDQLATSLSGTKPYMAPEIFDCALNRCQGYSFRVDWWSLGITAYEILKGKRPFDIHSNTPLVEVREMFDTAFTNSSHHDSESIMNLLWQMICVDEKMRISSVQSLRDHSSMKEMDICDVYHKRISPIFVPAKDQLNCDPTFELEEMIIEANPLHKKKKRLSKQHSKKEHKSIDENDPLQVCLETIHDEFLIFNRVKEIKWKEKERKASRSSEMTEESETDEDSKEDGSPIKEYQYQKKNKCIYRCGSDSSINIKVKASLNSPFKMMKNKH